MKVFEISCTQTLKLFFQSSDTFLKDPIERHLCEVLLHFRNSNGIGLSPLLAMFYLDPRTEEECQATSRETEGRMYLKLWTGRTRL